MLRKVLALALCVSFLKCTDAGTITFTTPAGGDSTISVEEGAPTSAIITFVATSTTAGAVTYADEAGNGAATAQFDVANTGAVTLKTGQSFDHDTTPSFTLKVVATDQDSATQTGTVTINVNANVAPTFSPTTKSTCVPESSASGYSVDSCTATDANNAAPNNAFTYAYSGDDTSAKFSIVSASGALTRTAVALDINTKSLYPLVIVATDGGTPNLAGTCTVTVTIKTDCNSATVLSGTLVAITTALLSVLGRQL